MLAIVLELTFILALVLLNGVLAMSEIALVSARKSRLEQQAAQGKRSAQIALKLATAPGNFMASVQIGITLVGILAGAFGGATLAKAIEESIQDILLLAPHSQVISLALVVTGITYLSLVFGELAPKRVALYNPEKTAMRIAAGMQFLSKLTAPLSNLLSRSTDLVLRLVGSPTASEGAITEEDIKALVRQGAQAGIVAELEQQMVSGVFWLGDQQTEALYTPRTEIEWLDINKPVSELGDVVLSSPHSVFPVGQGSLDNIAGIISAKELISRAKTDPGGFIKVDDLEEPFVVPASMAALQLLQVLRQCDHNMVLVIDEHGGLSGLVTPQNILDAIIGNKILVDPNGQHGLPNQGESWLLTGLTPVDQLVEALPILDMLATTHQPYKTLGGMIATHLGRIPEAGEGLDYAGWRFDVVQMDRRRVDLVRITRSDS
jgi:putative hemolysin